MIEVMVVVTCRVLLWIADRVLDVGQLVLVAGKTLNRIVSEILAGVGE